MVVDKYASRALLDTLYDAATHKNPQIRQNVGLVQSMWRFRLTMYAFRSDCMLKNVSQLYTMDHVKFPRPSWKLMLRT